MCCDLVSRNRYDVILMDIQMPVMDGLEVSLGSNSDVSFISPSTPAGHPTNPSNEVPRPTALHHRRLGQLSRLRQSRGMATFAFAATKYICPSRAQCSEAGMDDFVPKPIKLHMLEQSMNRVPQTCRDTPKQERMWNALFPQTTA